MIRALRIVLAAVVLAGAGIVAPVAGIGPVEEARAAATDLTLVTDALYTVRPDDRRVGVAVTISAVNHTRETKTRKFYFDHAYLAVQPGTTGFRLAGEKGARVRIARRGKDATLLRLEFGRRLYSGASAVYRLTFDLVGAGRGANPQTRVGASLVTVPLWAFASNGARGSTVEVAFPQGWDVSVATGSMPGRVEGPGGGTSLRSGPIAAPLTWFAYVIGQRPAVYSDRTIEVATTAGQVPIVLRSWVDDKAWAKRTAVLLEQGLPALHAQIGLPWPHLEPVVVQEAVNRGDGAYAGLYDPVEGRIEVAYWADGLTTLHEAAHGWFNGTLLADRWANEGFASLYAERIATLLDVTGTPPVMTDALREAAAPLNAWPLAGQASDSPGSVALEGYGYAASRELAAAIAERAGDDALRRVWAAAAARAGAYQPPTTASDPPETVAGAPDWRGLLDLLEQETGKDFSDLWRTWVVRPGESGLLDARASAREGYQRTLALAGSWRLPRDIRDNLRAWRFDEAARLMADARTVLAQHAALAEMAEARDLILSERMRPLFEAGRLAEASAEAEAQRNAILVIDQASQVHPDEGDLLVRIGMLGGDPEADLAAAREALSEGDLEGARASADTAYRTWAGAWSEGRRRAMLVLAAIATLLVVTSALAGARRGRRRRRHAHPRGRLARPG